MDELERDMQGVALPRPEIHLVVRYGPSTNNGLDVYAMGGRQSVHRKRLPGGQRVVTARLQLGTAEAVLGVPALAIAGRVVPLDALWGDAPTRRLLDALADARDLSEASRRLERAIAERLTSSDTYQARNQLVLDAAGRLPTASVSAVADDLGLSERHLRRVFREALGVGPKTYAKLLRFRDALRVARAEKRPGWARIAATAGYYDQAHLIAEFRAFAGVTPQALWAELRVGYSLG